MFDLNDASGSLRIEDRISGRFGAADAFFHLHPDVVATMVDAHGVALSLPDGGSAQVTFAGVSSVEVRPGRWHPRFGTAVGNQHIVARFSGELLTSRIVWSQR